MPLDLALRVRKNQTKRYEMATFEDIEINDMAKLARILNIDFEKIYLAMKQVSSKNY